MHAGTDYIGVGVGAVIINPEGKIFLAQRGPKAENENGKWECPGGIVDFGEKLEAAVKREIQEEFGFNIEAVELLDVCNHILPDEHQHWVSPSFICKVLDGIPRILEPETCEQIGWFTRLEVDKLPLSVATQHNLKVLLKKYPNTFPSFYD